MKTMIFTLAMSLALAAASGQQKQGRVLYERTIQLQLHLQGMVLTNDEAEHMLPHSRKDKLEVLFGENQSLLRTVAEEDPEELARGEGAMRVQIMSVDANDVTYTDLTTAQVVEQKELGTKTYIVTDSIRKLNWKLTGKTSTILQYPCQQAISRRIGKRIQTSLENGLLKNQEVADTSNIIVWFTTAIPVSAGPDYQGQLPGLILAIDINDGHTVYQAIEVSPEINPAAIKVPSKGKKITAAAFIQERDKLMKGMSGVRSAQRAIPIR